MIQTQKTTGNSQTRWPGIWLVALGAALWGTDSIIRVPLLNHFTSVQIVFLEHVLLAFYAVPVIWITRSRFRNLGLRELGAILFISWGGSGLATVLFTAAFQYGNASVILLLQKLQPVFVFLMAQWLLKEALPARFGVDLIAALGGTYLLTFGFSAPSTNLVHGQLTGSMLAIGAAALWGGSTVMGRILLNKLTFETVTAARFLFALPFMGLMLVVSHGSTVQMAANFLTASSLLNLLLQAFVPGLVSLLLYYRGLSSTKASYATLAELAFPATGVLLNWLVLHQGLSAGQWIGFIVIWLVVYHLSREHNVEQQVEARRLAA